VKPKPRWPLPDGVLCAAPAAKPCGRKLAVSAVDVPGRQEAVTHHVPVCGLHLDREKWGES
jgi:hypothetical protein